MRKILSLTIAAAMLMASAAEAKQCRDDKGKFIKCPDAPIAERCRDSKTKQFVKCGTPGSEAVPVASKTTAKPAPGKPAPAPAKKG